MGQEDAHSRITGSRDCSYMAVLLFRYNIIMTVQISNGQEEYEAAEITFTDVETGKDYSPLAVLEISPTVKVSEAELFRPVPFTNRDRIRQPRLGERDYSEAVRVKFLTGAIARNDCPHTEQDMEKVLSEGSTVSVSCDVDDLDGDTVTVEEIETDKMVKSGVNRDEQLYNRAIPVTVTFSPAK